MLSQDEFRQYGHEMIDWIADYFGKIEDFKVTPAIQPGSIRSGLPKTMPEQAERMETVWADFQRLVPQGLTHWQHPGFMALFPSNNSYPSILAELLAAGLGINAMMWDTSPVATELEEVVMEWLRNAMGLPEGWKGVINDTASTSTLTAIISAREKSSGFHINASGFQSMDKPLVLYCSDQAHYSVEKGAKAAGFGIAYVKKIASDMEGAMRVDKLEEAIEEDIRSGLHPCIVVATLGTTGTLAFDPLADIGKLCNTYGLWLHVDAAYAGAAFLLPEYQHYLQGIAMADSFVFNAHKWMLTNFDCSCYFVRDVHQLIKTFTANPEYLQRTQDAAANYKDWGLPLGRRFRALKLWFVLRTYGKEGIIQYLHKHIQLAETCRKQLLTDQRWQAATTPAMNMLCMYYAPAENMDQGTLNTLNRQILDRINKKGNFLLSGTTFHGKYILRIVPGGTLTEMRHILQLVQELKEAAEAIQTD